MFEKINRKLKKLRPRVVLFMGEQLIYLNAGLVTQNRQRRQYHAEK